MIVAASSYAGDFPPFLRGSQRDYVLRAGAPYFRWGIYTAIRAIYGAAAGAAAIAVHDAFSSDIRAVVAATAAATLVAEPLDLLLAALTFHIRGGRGRDIINVRPVCSRMPFYARSSRCSPWRTTGFTLGAALF